MKLALNTDARNAVLVDMAQRPRHLCTSLPQLGIVRSSSIASAALSMADLRIPLPKAMAFEGVRAALWGASPAYHCSVEDKASLGILPYGWVARLLHEQR